MVMRIYGGPSSIRRILLLVNMHYIISVRADIHASIRIPPDTNSINLEIVAQTATEGDTVYKVGVLMIENIGRKGRNEKISDRTGLDLSTYLFYFI